MFENIGAIILQYLPGLDDFNPYYVGIIAIFFTIFICVVAAHFLLVRLFRALTKLVVLIKQRPTRKERLLSERTIDLELARRKLELDVIRLQQTELKNRRRYHLPFTRLTLARRLLDKISAASSAFAPKEGLLSELAGFDARIALSGDSAVGQMKAELAQVTAKDKAAPEKFEEAKKIALAKANVDIAELNTAITELDDEIGRDDKRDETEETKAASIVSAWERTLGRVAYQDNFNSFFEININRWITAQSAAQSDERKDNALTFPIEQTPGRTVWGRVKLYIKTWVQAFFANIPSIGGSLRAFTYLAVTPELLYSYIAFNALANGDQFTAIAATVVFTVGLLAIGQMSGIACTRARYREGPPGTAKPRWNPLMAAAASAFILTGAAAVYAGATLRGSTGPIIRLQQQIESGMRQHEPADSISARQTQIENIINNPTPPTETTEGRIALFIYSVFFLASLTARIFTRDPVFEFGLAVLNYNAIRRARLERQWLSWPRRWLLKSFLKRAEKIKIEIQNQTFGPADQLDRARLEQEITRLEQLVGSYRTARLRHFGNTLMKFRRDNAKMISEWLSDHCRD
jgi:hypothetical protein